MAKQDSDACGPKAGRMFADRVRFIEEQIA
jgi:hypothetical protein